MFMKKLTIIFLFALIALLLTSGVVLAEMTSGGGFQIWADVISVGGIEQATSSGGFYLDDTLGEAVTGKSSTTNNTIGAGFQEMVKGDILSLSISPTSLSLGTLSKTSEHNATHSLYLECNATSGVSVSYTGSTLTKSGGSTIAPLTTPAASIPGVSQFVFNVTGGSVAAPQSPYNVAGQYAFSGGDIISSASPTAGQETFSIKYIANISGSEPEGSYSTGIIYTALANF